MKKRLFVLCSVFLFTGCSSGAVKNVSVTEPTELQTEEVMAEAITEKVTSDADAYDIDIPQMSEETDWQKAYKQALYDFMDSDEYFSGNNVIEHSAFSLYDLNTDGIPELIISEDTSHAAGCHIYTYDNGFIYLGKYGAYGDIGYCRNNDEIVIYNIGQGIEHEIFFKLENNEMNMLAKFYNDYGYYGEENATYKFNDTEVTKDEYDAKLMEYHGIEYVSLGRDYSFDEIDRVFSE